MSLALPSRRLAPAWVRDGLWRRARAVPSLDLRFAENKSLVDAISGQNLITFTRASSGTYVNSAGVLQTAGANEPRFDNNPTTGESLGLLEEEQRTNLNTNSEAFDTYGLAAGSVSANQGVAPDGTFSADEITSTGGGAYQSVSGVTASTTYTVSVYAKYVSGGSGFLFGCDVNPSEARVVFNLQAGTTSAIGANVVSHSMTLVGNGWYRCAVTFVATSTSLVFVSYNAISGSKWLCWGAQLEAGAFASSYIPTTDTAATRSADVASITGSNLTSWFNASFGTVFCGTSALRNASGVIYGFGDTFDNTLYVTPGSSNNVLIRSGGALTAFLTAPISTSGVSRSAVAYQLDNFAAASDGGTVSTDTSGEVPINPVRFKIGSSPWDTTASNNANGHISRLTYWPQRLSNATLQAITL